MFDDTSRNYAVNQTERNKKHILRGSLLCKGCKHLRYVMFDKRHWKGRPVPSFCINDYPKSNKTQPDIISCQVQSIGSFLSLRIVFDSY